MRENLWDPTWIQMKPTAPWIRQLLLSLSYTHLCYFLCCVNVTTPFSALSLAMSSFFPLPDRTKPPNMTGDGRGLQCCLLVFISFGFVCRAAPRQLWMATVSAPNPHLIRQTWLSGFSLFLGATPRRNSPRIFDKQLMQQGEFFFPW